MFPLGATGCKLTAQPMRAPYTIMGSSNITIYMPTTGERPDIGWITDNSAYYMLGMDFQPMLDWANANDSCPMHFRDETTGKPIDLIKYPQANAADLPDLQGRPFLPKGPPDPQAPQYSQFGGGWTPQQAHYCEMSYVAHMATLDPGFLENLQYNANFTVLCNASQSTAAGAVLYGETRGIGWALRNLFMAHTATVDAEARGDLPTTCHPSAYFKQLLDNALVFYNKIAAEPSNQTFRLINEFSRFSPWTVDYLLTALAFGILTGHSDWAPLYLWCLGNVIARTNGTSGYPPGLGTSYRLNTTQGGDPTKAALTWGQAFDELVGDPEASITQAQHDALMADPLNGGNAMVGNEYMMTTRAVLVMADYLDGNGLASVRTTYPAFDLCLKNAQTMFLNYGLVNPRVSVISQTVIIQPPQGGLMPTSFSIAVGETKELDFQDTDGTPIRLSDTPTYTQDNEAVFSLAPNGTKVIATGLAPGLSHIIGSGHGAGGAVVTGESDGTVTVPLSSAGQLVPVG